MAVSAGSKGNTRFAALDERVECGNYRQDTRSGSLFHGFLGDCVLEVFMGFVVLTASGELLRVAAGSLHQDGTRVEEDGRSLSFQC